MVFEKNKYHTFGIEKEFNLVIVDLFSGQTFNFNYADFLVDNIDFFDKEEFLKIMSRWSIVKEYSQNLIEIVSPVFDIKSIDKLFYELEFIENYLNKNINNFFKEKVKGFNSEKYLVRLESYGTSRYSKNITKDFRIVDNLDNPKNSILDENRHFIDKHSDLEIDLGGKIINPIGIYNNLSSVHITFCPSLNNNFEYIRFFKTIPKIIKKYKKYDLGNKNIEIDEKEVFFKNNLRDIFLEKLYPKITNENKFYFKHKPEITDLIGDGLDDIDYFFKKKNYKDFRPRIIENKFLAVEIRDFGSNLDNMIIKKIILDLMNYDKN